MFLLRLFIRVLFGIQTSAFARPILLQEDDYSSNYFKWLMNEGIRSQLSPLTKDLEDVKYYIGELDFSSWKMDRNSEINQQEIDHHHRMLEIRSFFKTFKLFLKKQSGIISPSMKVRYRREEHGMNAEEMNNCLFEGSVWSDTEDDLGSAAFSTCDNGLLTGIIKTKNNRYLIQPLPLQVRDKRQITSDKIVIVELSESNSPHCCAVKCMPIPNIEAKSAEAKSKFVAKRRTIETAVFVDQPMVEWASRNSDANPMQSVINLVLTIMNGVQTVFNDPSLEIEFHFVLVLLEAIEDNQDAPDAANGQINVYLNNFCNWQNDKKLALAKKGLASWDHGLLLSGRELHTDEDQKRSAGLSWVSGMCRETLSCSINEGSSFNAIHVISHQLGHNLGMVHDGKGNSCPSDSNLMSSELDPARGTWSTCSNDYSYVYLAQQYADCLDNEAESNSKLNFSNAALPGQLFSADKQCEMAFGASFHPYIIDQTPFEDICRELWCANGTHVKKSHPALLGTTCDQLKICKRGKCVAQSSTTEDTFSTSTSFTAPTNILTTLSPSGTTTLASTRNTQSTTSPVRRTMTSSDRSTLSSSSELQTTTIVSTTLGNSLTLSTSSNEPANEFSTTTSNIPTIVSTTIGTSLTNRTSTSTLTPTLNPTTETSTVTIPSMTVPTTPFSNTASSKPISSITVNTERFGTITSTINISRITTSSPSMTPYRIPPGNENTTSSTERFGTITSPINVPTRIITSPSMTPYRIPPGNETISEISMYPTQSMSTNAIPFRTTLTFPTSTLSGYSPNSSSFRTTLSTKANYELTTSATRISLPTTVPLFDIIIDNMNNKNSNRTENDEEIEYASSIDIRILNNQTESN